MWKYRVPVFNPMQVHENKPSSALQKSIFCWKKWKKLTAWVVYYIIAHIFMWSWKFITSKKCLLALNLLHIISTRFKKVILLSNDNWQNAHRYLTGNYLNIELKISDQEGHVLSNMPHWSKALPSMLGYRWLSRVISNFSKVNMILMHSKSPWFFQLHLCPFKTKQILEYPLIPKGKIAINKKE